MDICQESSHYGKNMVTSNIIHRLVCDHQLKVYLQRNLLIYWLFRRYISTPWCWDRNDTRFSWCWSSFNVYFTTKISHRNLNTVNKDKRTRTIRYCRLWTRWWHHLGQHTNIIHFIWYNATCYWFSTRTVRCCQCNWYDATITTMECHCAHLHHINSHFRNNLAIQFSK